MMNKTFNRQQYLNYSDLNDVEIAIYNLVTELKSKTDIGDFNNKTWVLNEFPWIEEIDRIEKAIENIGFHYFKPAGWIAMKEWLDKERKASFDYNDVNRWINNLNLMYKYLNDNLTIWNGVSYITWNEVSETEWEE